MLAQPPNLEMSQSLLRFVIGGMDALWVDQAIKSFRKSSAAVYAVLLLFQTNICAFAETNDNKEFLLVCFITITEQLSERTRGCEYVLSNGSFTCNDDERNGLRSSFTKKQIESLEQCIRNSKDHEEPRPSDFGLSSPTWRDFEICKGPKVDPYVDTAAKQRLDPSPDDVQNCLNDALHRVHSLDTAMGKRWIIELNHGQCSVAFSDRQFAVKVRDGADVWITYDVNLRRELEALIAPRPYAAEQLTEADYTFSERLRNYYCRPEGGKMDIWFWNRLAGATLERKLDQLDEKK